MNDHSRRWSLWNKRVIPDLTTGGPYLIRWELFSTPWFGVKLHHIVAHDFDRDLHDHPWPFLSIVLRGWYDEEVPVTHPLSRPWRPWPVETRTRRVRWWNFKRARGLHRISKLPAGGVWTLFVCGARSRDWGFQTERGWMQWQHYIARRAEAVHV